MQNKIPTKINSCEVDHEKNKVRPAKVLPALRRRSGARQRC